MKLRRKRQSGQADTGPEQISTDPFGSYTGRPENPEERPIQDADDL